jgi:Pentapeptide repeats (8 copies)
VSTKDCERKELHARNRFANLLGQPMSQTNKTQGNPKKFSFIKWGSILATPIALAAIVTSLTVPEVRCLAGLKSEICTAERQEIQLITQTERGDTLPGVKLQYISQGAPEVQYTDNNGFARVSIPSKGDVQIILTKEGYPTQDFTIDLQNDQSKTRTVRFAPSGTPAVTALSSGTPPSPVPSQALPESNSSPINLPTGASSTGDAVKNLETLVRTKKCSNCNLVGADLGSAHLENADLRGANLRGARGCPRWNAADLSGADLRGFSACTQIDIQGANLRGANLEGASLVYANLRGADLSDVDLSNVNLDKADFSGAILPKGFEPPK